MRRPDSDPEKPHEEVPEVTEPNPPPEVKPTGIPLYQPDTPKRQAARVYVWFLNTFIRWRFEAVEFQSALTAAIFGVWLCSPAEEFDAAIYFYHSLGNLAPPALIGAFVALIGVTQLVALIFHHRRLRRATSLVTASLWVFFAILFALTGFALLTPVHAVLAVFSAWAYLRLGKSRVKE